ncbi:unnamed protein product [Miscanthus lutarioriparius]|uniref:Uncharacterized protein n=1 Tax=Miscanthus lutarioriparius TaxID=422564 RepID=A0A811NJW9_9POAL|nr:unnamed protein product [Miscanthus lutarioriparius]
MKGATLVFLGLVCVHVLAFRPCGGRAWPPVAKTPYCAGVATELASKARTGRLPRHSSKSVGFWADGSLEGSSVEFAWCRSGSTQAERALVTSWSRRGAASWSGWCRVMARRPCAMVDGSLVVVEAPVFRAKEGDGVRLPYGEQTWHEGRSQERALTWKRKVEALVREGGSPVVETHRSSWRRRRGGGGSTWRPLLHVAMSTERRRGRRRGKLRPRRTAASVVGQGDRTKGSPWGLPRRGRSGETTSTTLSSCAEWEGKAENGRKGSVAADGERWRGRRVLGLL